MTATQPLQRSTYWVRHSFAASGPLRKIFLQKKFEDPKMVGEFLPLPDLDYWLRYQPFLRRFSEI